MLHLYRSGSKKCEKGLPSGKKDCLMICINKWMIVLEIRIGGSLLLFWLVMLMTCYDDDDDDDDGGGGDSLVHLLFRVYLLVMYYYRVEFLSYLFWF